MLFASFSIAGLKAFSILLLSVSLSTNRSAFPFSLSRILAGFSVNQRLKNPFLFLSLLLCLRFYLLIFLSFFLFFFPFGFNIWKLLFDFPFFKLLWKLLFFFLIILETSISCHTQMEGLSQNKVLMGYMDCFELILRFKIWILSYFYLHFSNLKVIH